MPKNDTFWNLFVQSGVILKIYNNYSMAWSQNHPGMYYWGVIKYLAQQILIGQTVHLHLCMYREMIKITNLAFYIVHLVNICKNYLTVPA
jgi:hypothetical protein